MPVELFLSPFMGPLSRIQSLLYNIHRQDSHYTPVYVDMPANVRRYHIRKEFGTGSKILGVFDASDPTANQYSKQLYYLSRSRAVKGAYKLYGAGEELPVATLRAGPESNVLLIKSQDGSELELGWHVVSYKVDALDAYRIFELADGHVYQWTNKGHFLERVINLGEKESERRERVASVVVHTNKKGFDLVVDDTLNLEMVITTAMICYVEAWNTIYGYGGIYGARSYAPSLSWKRD